MSGLLGRRNVAFVTIAAMLLAATLAYVGATPARAEVDRTISGKVTLPDGAPTSYYTGMIVNAANVAGGNSHNAGVNPDGTYTISVTTPGLYRILFWPRQYQDDYGTWYDTPLQSEYYSDKSYEDADTVDVTTNSAEDIDATLAWASGGITGTVSLADGVPATSMVGLQAVATTEGAEPVVAAIDPDTGAYSLTHLLPRPYAVYFAPSIYLGGDLSLQREYYNDVYDISDAAEIDVYSTVITGIDAQLDRVRHFTSAPNPVIVHGTLALGSTLGIDGGHWSPNPDWWMQWYRNGVAIPKATDPTYKLTAADQGTNVTVAITAVAYGYTTVVRTSAPLYVTFPFTKTVTPVVKYTGSLKAGTKLTAYRYTWTPAVTSAAYQWKRDGVAIPGATTYNYTLTTADRGHSITCTVTGKKAGYTTTAKTSAALQIPKVFIAKVPTITGTARSGYTLTAHRGTWTPTPAYSYQWYRNGVKISGATKYTYKLTSSDKGKKITVRVIGKRSGYLTASISSAAKTIAK